MLIKIDKLVKNYTVPIIVTLFLAYSFSDKALWIDFNGYVASLGVPARKFVLAIMMFLGVLYILHRMRDWFMPQLLKKFKLRKNTQASITSIMTYVAFLIAFLVGLSVMGVNLQSLGLLLSALSVGLGFGLQHVVNNFISGILIMFERPFRIGDWIVINGKEGIVYKINIRSTELETFDKAIVIIPNADIISGELTNWTLTDANGRLTVDVGVAYGTDLEKALQLALQSLSHDDRILDNPKPSAIVTAFGDSSINIQLRCFLANIMNKTTVRSDVLIRMYRLFQDNGIEIPFPQRVVTVIHQNESESRSATVESAFQ